MSPDWALQFCLACDRQTDGAAYCSESCRLAEYEKTASAQGSAPSNHPRSVTGHSASLSGPRPQQPKFYLSPAYDFSHAEPYGTTPQQRQSSHPSRGNLASPSLTPSSRTLTPSSSHSSLCSMRSTSSSSSEASQLSVKAARELRAYASSFEQVRMQRRRSY